MTNSAVASPVRLRPDIAQLPPYRQGDQAGPGALKLSSNENPFDPLPGVLAAMRSVTALNRYPDGSALELRTRLAERFGAELDAVHVAGGSASILQQLALATSAPGDELVYPWRSFEGYPWMAAVSGATPVVVPLRENGAADLAAMAAAVSPRTRLVVVCTPNNPTGATVTAAEVEAFLARIPSDVLVVLDEAYAEFVTDPTAVSGPAVLAAGHANVVTLRTFSKAYGLAGLRIGYALGHPRVLQAARIVSVPFAVTAPAQAAALASLDAQTGLDERVATIIERRDRLIRSLREAGWQLPSAQGNFVWLPTPGRVAEAERGFRAAGLVVRPFETEGVRITVSEEESIARVAAVAATLLPAHNRRREGARSHADR